MMIRLSILLVFLFFSLNIHARTIISGISSNKIEIDTDFTGEEILLFGSKEIFGDIFIVIKGSKHNFFVNKKGQILGVWVNKERLKFENAYGYYATFGNYQFLKNSRLFSALEMSEKDINFNISRYKNQNQKEEFKVEFVNNLTKQNLYMTNSGKIDFLNENLFKVMLKFPKNISEGIYNVEIYLIEDGNLSGFQSIPISVNKVGFSATISNMAFNRSVFYGFIAISIAIFASLFINTLVSIFSNKER